MLQFDSFAPRGIAPFTDTLPSTGLIAIVGPNGSGKTTLLKSIAQIIAPTSGKVYWKGIDLQAQARFILKSLIAFVPATIKPNFPFSVLEMVLMGRYQLAFDRNSTQQALEVTEIVPFQNIAITELSSGELQRVLIARALATDTPILLLDEPTNFLDRYFKDKITSYLLQLKRHKLVLVATHDEALTNFSEKKLLID